MTKQLINLATKKTFERVRFTLSDADIAKCKSDATDALMKFMDLEEKMKEMQEEYKEKMKPLKAQMKFLTTQVRNGFVDREMDVYNVPDDDRKVIEWYDDKNNKVGERRMRPEELPTINFNEEKTY